MIRWLPATVLCALSILTWSGQAVAQRRADPSGGLGPSGVGAGGVRQVGASRRGGADLYKTSAKGRRIGARLAATGYYSYYSKALRGYPELRSKAVPRREGRAVAVNAQSRKKFIPHVETVARLYRLDPELIDAVISVESAYDPQAVSNKGALGLMQLMPGTARRFAVADPMDPVANMHGGAKYLRWLMDRFDNDLDLVLAAYNAGEGALEENGNRIPPYAETRAYVARVRKLYADKQKAP